MSKKKRETTTGEIFYKDERNMKSDVRFKLVMKLSKVGHKVLLLKLGSTPKGVVLGHGSDFLWALIKKKGRAGQPRTF